MLMQVTNSREKWFIIWFVNISTVTSRTHERTGYPSTMCPTTYKMKNILAHYIYMHPFNKIIINSSKTSQFATHNKLLRKARTNELRYVVNSNAQNMKLQNSQIWYNVQWINDELRDPFSDVGVIPIPQEFLVTDITNCIITKHTTHTRTLSTNHGHYHWHRYDHWSRMGWNHG
jgi:hypothetical protein